MNIFRLLWSSPFSSFLIWPSEWLCLKLFFIPCHLQNQIKCSVIMCMYWIWTKMYVKKMYVVNQNLELILKCDQHPNSFMKRYVSKGNRKWCKVSWLLWLNQWDQCRGKNTLSRGRKLLYSLCYQSHRGIERKAKFYFIYKDTHAVLLVRKHRQHSYIWKVRPLSLLLVSYLVIWLKSL